MSVSAERIEKALASHLMSLSIMSRLALEGIFRQRRRANG